MRQSFYGNFFLFFLIASPVVSKERSPLPFDAFDGEVTGGRAAGMGEAFTALASSGDGPMWNPAGLSKVKTNIFSMTLDAVRHSSAEIGDVVATAPLRGKKLVFLGFSAPYAGFWFRPIANLEKRIVTDFSNPAQNFDDADIKIWALGISGAAVKEDVSLGYNLSYLNGRVGVIRTRSNQPVKAILSDGNGISLGMGLQWTYAEVINLGVFARNIPGVMWWDDFKKDQLPINFRLGSAYQPSKVLTFSGDFEKSFKRRGGPKPNIWHFGIEVHAASWLSLRGGAFSEDFDDPTKTFITWGLSGYRKGHILDIGVRKYRVSDQNVYNFIISLTAPLTFSSLETTNQSTLNRSFPPSQKKIRFLR